ncbi:hypothetical protein [Plantactinospora sp. KBS50]|uniref:hypothetical protein n=1 Tax=Plantactinospora sp. KBS50 TaxID=2024580 RepID=UPI0018DF2ED1|nr:hypothetical protein [Plantactinospora sp. KBS50]
MPQLRRIAALLLSMVTVSGVLVLVTGTPSQAAVSCSGTVSYNKNYGPGELTIYYNSSNGGTNSACFYHQGAAYGVAAPTYVRTYRCTQTSGEGQPCTIAASSSADSGNYAYYAGPRGVTGAANYCVAAEGYIEWQGFTYYISSGRQGC